MSDREGKREGKRVLMRPREQGGSSVVSTRTRNRVMDMIIDNSPGGSFNTSGPGKKGKNPLVLNIILIYNQKLDLQCKETSHNNLLEIIYTPN